MSYDNLIVQYRKMSLEELENELLFPYLDENLKDIVLNEISLRRSRKITWHTILSLALSVFALLISVATGWNSIVAWFS
ncbi:hypothetical protein [Aliivibrio fischeri]|uniref:hypothetical protein n=1 Tax=Aliivibrio fischeri TaxID=668 RepID=UPI00064C12A8|nr:hypothetical protein [Aliivibrio fischeri]KLU80179.1 hypothetical protein AB192_05690 [Aliivibrio fischeri]